MNVVLPIVWVEGAHLNAADLMAQFKAIRDVVNGQLESSNFTAGVVDLPPFVNAGDSRFQTGGLDNSQLVAAAIAEAVAGTKKIVFVPYSMRGYAADAGFAPAMFDTSIAMVHEGGPWDGHDPIAYGAKPDDPTVDDAPSIQAAEDGAADSTNPLPPKLSFSVMGEYEIDTAITTYNAPVVIHGGQYASIDGLHSPTVAVDNDVTFAGAQVATFKPNLGAYSPPVMLQASGIFSQAALADSTPWLLGDVAIDNVPPGYILKTAMGRARNTSVPDAYDETWAVMISPQGTVGSWPETGIRELGVEVFPGTTAGTQKWVLFCVVEQTSGAAADVEVELQLVIEKVPFLRSSIA